MLLENINPHIRDKNILFDEPKHIYTVIGDNSKYTSVTTFVHNLFPQFNSDKIISKMMNSNNWINNKYYGMNADEIKKDWDKNRDQSAYQGTKMHEMIEDFYNNNSDFNIINKNMTEMIYFQDFLEDFKDIFYKPYRTEWRVYDEDWKLSGSIDMVFENKDGTLSIVDWKRCKNITKEPFNDNDDNYSLVEEISYMPNTNFWHYSMQLNIYKAILERKYNKIIRDLTLINLHPNNSMKSYQMFDVEIISPTIINSICSKNII